jgi:hypothetical protein
MAKISGLGGRLYSGETSFNIVERFAVNINKFLYNIYNEKKGAV